jgi:hypothetical protein
LALNEGPQSRRYAICNFCGQTIPVQDWDSKKPQHQHPRTGKDCSANRSIHALAHDFQTDALFISVPGIHSVEQARSVLYGLLAGAAEALEMARDDLDGTVQISASHTLVLFDAVPAGAGLVRRIAENLDAVIDGMLRKVRDCECGIETSCHRCLRVYRNQVFHEDLKRDHVLALYDGSRLGTDEADSDQDIVNEGYTSLTSLTDLVEGDFAILSGPLGRVQGTVLLETDDGAVMQIGVDVDGEVHWNTPDKWSPVARKAV